MEGGIVKSSDIELQSESNRIETVQDIVKSAPITPTTSCSSTSTTVHVKTLVWEVACNESQPADSDYPHAPAPVTLFYIVTAQKTTDRVDVSRLQDLVCKQHHELQSGRTLHPSQLQQSRVSISMAPTVTAEYLTGFQSGCMPPIGHTTPMKLYVEESIVDYDTASVGSGSLGHSLLLPTKQLFKCAENNGHGLLVGCFASATRTGSPSSVLVSNISRQDKKPKLPRWGTEPKDRLKEYKSLACITEKAQLLRTTSRKKGRVETMKHLIDEAVHTGDFPHLMSTSAEVGVNKNALHLCSWKGDFDTVKYLVETSKRFYPEIDLINTISKSDGNYGKTPIFYALTQCRGDVVRYLVSEGASLLYVNNKGQTPCSIAVSHMEEDTCQFLYDAEAKELGNGGVFVNYRESHSDSKFYGDLDPRFEIDADNFGDDLTLQLQDFRESLAGANGATIHNNIPTKFSPRSLRPTVRWWKREDKSLANANFGGGSGEVTFSQPRKSKPKPKAVVQPSGLRQPKQCQTSSLGTITPLDVDSLDRLTIEQVHDPQLLNGCTNGEAQTLVDCLYSLKALESEIDRTRLLAETLANCDEYTTDEALVETIWGLDCEWFPGKNCGRDNPVATLQLSTQRRSFLIDLQCLCQANTLDHLSAPNETEMELTRVLSKLFIDTSLQLIGFGVLADLGKLAASFPHLCFCLYNGVIDLQKISTIVLSKSDRIHASSLQATVAMVLERRLDKSEQCSDWTRRPLSNEQVDYATLDAAVLPFILKQMMEQGISERYKGNFFSTHEQLTSNIRFTFLQEDEPRSEARWHVPMGKITTQLSKQLSRQCWPSTQGIPDLPSKRILPSESRPTKKERAHIRKVDTNGGKRPKPVQLRDVMGKLDDLPAPGTTLGYTKDSCVHRVLGRAFINALPEQTHIGFNRRSGVIETSNAWIIFCNFGGSGTKRPSSGFLKEGREFRFNLNPNTYQGKSSEKSLCDFISSRQEIGLHTESDKNILLFARGSSRHKYTYCGTCTCIELIPTEVGSKDLLLNLVDYSQLVGDESIAGVFFELVQNDSANPAGEGAFESTIPFSRRVI